jgi:hypothetical protein
MRDRELKDSALASRLGYHADKKAFSEFMKK